MSDGYAAFLDAKAIRPELHGVALEGDAMSPQLFPFQAAITRWAIRRGRAAVFASTGLGKTWIQLEWASLLPGPALIVAPLAVAEQTAEIAGLLGRRAQVVRDGHDVDPEQLSITNYERLHRFDPAVFQAVVLDESSILKAIVGKTREKLVHDWTCIPYRLCCTATPAPNDLNELANHAEFLGICTRREMLATYFVHDDAGWRIKGHARDAFYRWLATWAVYIRTPADLGFDPAGYELPPLDLTEDRVPAALGPTNGVMFPTLAKGIQGRHAARRGSIDARVARTVELVRSNAEQWLVWCGLNDEGRALKAELGDACVLIEGSHSADEKVAREHAWRSGQVRVLVTKPSIFGWGLNWQHCHNMAFLGLGDSFEAYFQAIRRCWRFGQTQPVRVHIVLSDAEGAVIENVRRKEAEHERTVTEVVARMRDWERAEVVGMQVPDTDGYPTDEASGEGWRLLLGDACERLDEVEAGSLGLSVHSPPFAQLYTYSASMRDLGNSRSADEFLTHYGYLARALLRATMPGRRACVHVQQIALTKVMHDVIAWRDFRAEVVRLYQDAGWIYHGEVVVDKDPQAQAIRTKSKTLLFVQKNKDSSWSVPAMADYVLLFRTPGDNPVPVRTDVTNEEWILWARPIWYGIRESATLQASAARAERDEKHIAPLQLETVERCIRLWSNRGELVADPMAGIGTTGYVALRNGRRFVGIELKPEYWAQAARNLRLADTESKQGTWLELAESAEVPA